MRAAAAAVLAGLLALATPAAAQRACTGHISSTAIAPMPAEGRIAVALRDDSPRQVRLRDAVYAELRRQGRPVGDPPAYTMSWRGSLDRGGSAAATRSDLLFNDRDRFQESDDLSWMQGVPRTRRPGPPSAPSRLTGSVELREVATRRVVWTAVFTCDRQGMDDAALIATLAGAVVPVIGQTVSGRPF